MSESGSHGMPKDTSNVTRGLNRTKLPFLDGYVAIGGRDCNLRENEGRSENRGQIAVPGMPRMSPNGPLSKSCLFGWLRGHWGSRLQSPKKRSTTVFSKFYKLSDDTSTSGKESNVRAGCAPEGSFTRFFTEPIGDGDKAGKA